MRNGHNLIADTRGCILLGAGAGDILDKQAKLLPLADNGGPTATHALRHNSRAIDAGDDVACLPVDQRGVARPQDGDRRPGAVCDIGAVERTP